MRRYLRAIVSVSWSVAIVSVAQWLPSVRMSAYSQVKRQKVREVRPGENVDYFQGIEKVEFNNMAAATDGGGYRHFSAGERVHSKTMDDWLKYSLSLTDFRGDGSHSHVRSPHRPWDDGTPSLENHKRCVKALFDFCAKLGVRYWTAFDSDLVPMGESWEDTKQHWDEVVEYIQELSQRTHIKLLWLAPDLHSHPRYASGAFTSSEATTFAQAACQIKKCLEVSQRLNAECFLLWPHREGYDSVFQTDVAREIKLFAKLLKITAEYKDRLNYRCQLLLMPYHSWCGDDQGAWQPGEAALCRYMWDATSCLYLLSRHGLDRHYRLCTPPGHHMFMANVYNMLGGVVVTNDVNHYDNKKLTLMMKCIIDQGSPVAGGVHLRLPRREREPRELLALYVKYIDAIARGLRFAASLLAEQAFSKHLQQRYGSYYSGFGSRLASTDVSIEECEDYYKKNQSQHSESSARQETMDLMLQRYLDSTEHI